MTLCDNQMRDAAQADSRGEDIQAKQHVALVLRAVEAIWNRGELDVADVLFATSYVNHGGLIPDLVCGPEAIKFSVALYRVAYPNLRITMEVLTAEVDTALFQWIAHGASTDHRSGDPLASTGNALKGTLRCRIAGGQIVETWIQWNREGALTQLALLNVG